MCLLIEVVAQETLALLHYLSLLTRQTSLWLAVTAEGRVTSYLAFHKSYLIFLLLLQSYLIFFVIIVFMWKMFLKYS